MRKHLILVVSSLAAGLAAGACSKEHKSATATADNIEHGQTYEARADGDNVFEQAWEGFVEAGDDVGEAGVYVFHRGKDGAIVAGHGVQKVAGKVAQKSDDGAMVASVKTRLAATDDIDSDDIDVDADGGVITLRGSLSSRVEAARAVNVALSTRGVDRVVSYLTW